MNFVSFISSGASSRLHYVLVRKVESASSAQAADSIVSVEMKSITDKLADNPSMSLCKDYLIILLYCITVSTVSLPALDSVLLHAVNLAEAGQNISEKRIGYLFCAEMMPPRHQLQLMLVNTLRKDLESPNIANICLALDHLIHCGSEDVIPAVQSRLQDLLAYNSPQVRRRALLAFKALSVYDADLINSVQQVILRRVNDPDSSVCVAALVAACQLYELYGPARVEIQEAVTKLFRATWSKNYDERQRRILIPLLAAMRTLRLSESNFSLVMDVIRRASRRKDDVLLRAAILCLPPFPAQAALFASGTVSHISHVRSLLTSPELNQQYLFLTYLECLNPNVWAGTTSETPALLEQWEVEHVMGFLDSKDPILRKKTINVLNNVDENIVSSYYTTAFQNLPNVPADGKPEHVRRLLETLEARARVDGEHYAREVMTLLSQVDGPESQIFEDAIDAVLTHMRQSSDDLQRTISTYLLSYLLETKRQIGSTAMAIISALACENSNRTTLSSLDILKGLSSRLSYHPTPVQDACLLAMMRVSIDCENVPEEIVAPVLKLSEVSGRHIKQRCHQFIRLVSDKESLAKLVQNARSSTLPDFMEALEKYQSNASSHPSTSPSRSQESPTTESLSASKLRYTAYDAPVPPPRLRNMSNSNYSSEPSTLGSPHGISSPKLFAGGELALAASSAEFENEMSAAIASVKPLESDTTSRNDLIALDSPLSLNPPGGRLVPEMNFDHVWEGFAMEARGWYGESIDQLLRRMQIMDPSNVDMSVVEASLPPFVGELKVTLKYRSHVSSLSCALRLKESEEHSCLWRLRGNMPLYATVKNILTEDWTGVSVD